MSTRKLSNHKHERQEHVRYNERMKQIYELYLTKEYLDLG